jgi:hypothetical protein
VFLGGFPVNRQILPPANDRKASGEQRNPLFFVLKEANYYFCPLKSFSYEG